MRGSFVFQMLTCDVYYYMTNISQISKFAKNVIRSVLYHTGSEYPGIHVQLRYVFAGILKQRRFVTCDFASLLGVLS